MQPHYRTHISAPAAHAPDPVDLHLCWEGQLVVLDGSKVARHPQVEDDVHRLQWDEAGPHRCTCKRVRGRSCKWFVGALQKKGGGHALRAVGFAAGSAQRVRMLACAVVAALRKLTRAVGLSHQRLLVDLIQELAIHIPAQILQARTAGTAGSKISVGVLRQPASHGTRLLLSLAGQRTRQILMLRWR